MKRTTLFLLLSVALSFFPETIVIADDPPQGHPGLVLLETEMLDLDLDRVSSGILEDVGFTPVSFAPFDGYSLVDSNYVNYRVFGGLLEGLASSRVGGTVVPSDITTQMSSSFQSGNNPVGIIAYRYSRVKDYAVCNNLVDVDLDGTIHDKFTAGGEWINPYEEKYLVACSPYMNIVGNQVTYSFNSSQMVSNLTNVSSIQFHPGDAYGYRTIGSGTTTVSVTYPSQNSTVDLTIKITLSDQTILYSHSRVAVMVSSAPVFTSTPLDGIETFTSLSTYEGYQPSARVSIKYGTGSSSLTRPLIFAEGFDPFTDPYKILNGSSVSSIDTTGVGLNRIGHLNDVLGAAGLDSLDIVYIDWLDSQAPIEANADILQQVIRWVNNEKSGNGKNLLVGESMGGLIARYALRTMELANEQHECISYVSIDTPHYGANIPLCVLFAAQHLYDFLQIESDSILNDLCSFLIRDRTGNTTASANVYLNELLNLRTAPSVRQMLVHYVNANYELDSSSYSSLQSLLSICGFPQGDSGVGIRNLTISNGGSNNFTTGLEYLFHYKKTIGTGVLSEFFLNLLCYITDYEYFGILGLLPGLSSVTFETKGYPLHSSGQRVFEAYAVYTKKYGYMPDQSHYYFNYQHNAPNALCLLDDDYGSFFSQWSEQSVSSNPYDYLYGGFYEDYYLAPRFMFVPTVSSLHFKDWLNNLTPTERKTDFVSTGLNMDDIPFQGYRFHCDTSSSHTVLLSSDYKWIDRMLDLSLSSSPDTLSEPYCFTVLDAAPSKTTSYTIEWSVSDTSVATINASTGLLTPNLGGNANVYADILCLNGHLRLSRSVYIPEEVFPGFPNYTLKADANLLLNGFSGEYTITATQLSPVDARFKPYMQCHWGHKTSSTDPISWSEAPYNVIGNKLYYFFTIPESSSERRIYYYVSFRNQVSPTYSVFCLVPPVFFELDGEGNLYAEGINEPIAQVKGDSQEKLYYFRCLDKEFMFNHWPTSAEFCEKMLTSDLFVNSVKKMKPWGNETELLIPYIWTTGEDDTEQYDYLTIQFNETL